MVGYVQNWNEKGTMKQHKVQCFYAEQTKHYDLEKSKEITKGDVKIAKIIKGTENNLA